jgi:hypothetical protein
MREESYFGEVSSLFAGYCIENGMHEVAGKLFVELFGQGVNAVDSYRDWFHLEGKSIEKAHL